MLFNALAGIVANAVVTEGTKKLIGGDKKGAGSAAFEDMAFGQKRDRYTRLANQAKTDSQGTIMRGQEATPTNMNTIVSNIHSRAFAQAPNMARALINEAIAQNKSQAVIRQMKYDLNFSERDEGKRLK